MDRKKILIVEDELAISDLLAYGFKKEGFEVKVSNEGHNAYLILETYKPDLILLDLMLPDMTGFDICKRVTRIYNIPIIMLTAKSDITDKIIGLELGADDYITKPFDLREVITRVRVLLRRLENMQTIAITKEEDNYIELGFGIEINFQEHKVKRNNSEIELTPKEYNLLDVLTQNRGKVMSRDQLLDRVWGYSYEGDTRTVDIHIQRLRKKLNCNELIETVFGFGYKMIKK